MDTHNHPYNKGDLGDIKVGVPGKIVSSKSIFRGSVWYIIATESKSYSISRNTRSSWLP